MAKRENFTKKVTVAASSNLFELAKANGYQGSSHAADMLVVANSVTVAYFFYTSDAKTAPSTITDGLPFATTGAPTTSVGYTRQVPEDALDLATTWIGVTASVDIILMIKSA